MKEIFTEKGEKALYSDAFGVLNIQAIRSVLGRLNTQVPAEVEIVKMKEGEKLPNIGKSYFIPF